MADEASRSAARRIAWRERLIGTAARLIGPLRGEALVRWQSGLPALLYHRIVDRPDGDPFAVTAAAFERQVAWLDARYDLVSVAGLVARLAVPAPAPRPALAITFDDGYECTHRVALPILRSVAARATLFADTARLDGPRPGLSARELHELAEAVFEIGSHTVSHRQLTGLSPVELERELCDSRERLQDIIGAPVDGFAPPFGRYDDAIVAATRRAGYRYLCTCRQHGTNPVGQPDPFLVDRIEVNSGDDTARLEAKLEGRFARVYSAWYRLNPATRHWLEDDA